jgi:hypothetical protein
MCNVAEHDSKQEREENDGKQPRIDFSVSGDSVGVDD